MCVLSCLAALTLAQAARAPRLCHLAHICTPHPIPSAPGFSGDASKSICFLAGLLCLQTPCRADRVGLLMPGWWAGWRPLQPRCRSRTPCVWSPGSNPVRSRGTCRRVLCAALTQVWTRGAPVGSGEKVGARQSTAREAVHSQRNGILRPRSLRASPGPAVPPRAHGMEPPGTAHFRLLPPGGEAEGGGSRRGSSSPMPGPRGGAPGGLRRPLLAAVGRAWLTCGVVAPPDGVKAAADHSISSETSDPVD